MHTFYRLVFVVSAFCFSLAASSTVFTAEKPNESVSGEDSVSPLTSNLSRYEACQSKVKSLNLWMDKAKDRFAAQTNKKKESVCSKQSTVGDYEQCLTFLSEDLKDLKNLKATWLSLIQDKSPCPRDFTTSAISSMESVQKNILLLEGTLTTFQQEYQEVGQGASGKKYVQWRLKKCLNDIQKASKNMEQQALRYDKNNTYFLHQYFTDLKAHEDYILWTKDQCLNVATKEEDLESYKKTIDQIRSEVQNFQKQKNQVFQNRDQLFRKSADKMCQQLENHDKNSFRLVCNKKVQNASYSYTLHYFLQKSMCDRDDVVDFTCYPPPYYSPVKTL